MSLERPAVQAALESGPEGSVWIDLPQGADAGRTALARVESLLRQGVPGLAILVLVPQRQRRNCYQQLVRRLGPAKASLSPEVHTFYSLASRMVRLFWPEVAGVAGFARPLEPPVQLTYETAQFAMSQVVDPLRSQGFFDGLALRPQRLLSQLLDNLNKAAVNGYAIAEVGPRLRRAWTGEGERLVYFDQAQVCIEGFRAYCLAHNLVDVSLALEVFHRHLAPREAFRTYLAAQFRHLVAESVEETVPVAQDFIASCLDTVDSAFLVARRDGGYRVFLGVDPEGAWALRTRCQQSVEVPEGEPRPPATLGVALARRLELAGSRLDATVVGGAGLLLQARHRGEMLEAVTAEIARLVSAGQAAPGDIAVVAPHADGVLRFLLGEGLSQAGIPFAIVRRFESLREEPEVRVALALAGLARGSGWSRCPHPCDVAEALGAALGLDPVRALLLTRVGYDAGAGLLRPLDGPPGAELAGRLSEASLAGYETLRRWLEGCHSTPVAPLDLFFRRLFGEVLSRADLHPESAATYARLISSAGWFRRSAPEMGMGAAAGEDPSQGYARMVEEGVVSSAHVVPMTQAGPEAVLVVAPVHTYLLEERLAKFQFWLDVGAISWWEPPHQPLTNPYVLSRRWSETQRWTEFVDFAARNRVLARLVRGLCSRATERVYLCWSEVEAFGQPGDGPLLRAAAQLLTAVPPA